MSTIIYLQTFIKLFFGASKISIILDDATSADAFFPFVDGLKILIHAGVKTIVQPGGSIRDKEIIKEANKAKIKMVFTGLRHFNH